MRIGELAALAGVTTRTVRHYHHLGLLPEPARRANGYREYGLRDAVALARVRRLTELGLSLDEVRDGDQAVPYAGEQAALMYTLLFAAVVETVVLALLILWPVVHALVLVLDVWGVLLVLGLHVACVTRPHVVGADGSLRVRYGALVDVRVPAGRVAAARVEHRFPEGRLLRVTGGVLDLSVGGRTTVTVELTGPVEVVRPLGGRERARVLRFCAEDPRAAVAALREHIGTGAGTGSGADVRC